MLNQASYLNLLKEGALEDRIENLNKLVENCSLCPHLCGVDRNKTLGFCQGGQKSKVSSFGPHFGEESVLVGSKGSGTIFFAYCNMRCVYCQNHSLSFSGQGRNVSNEELAEMMLSIQNHYGCHNINVVTPSHFVANIVEAINIAAKKGLKLPIVYNCGGYESVEILKILDGIVDIYMPDFKYFSNETGEAYSQVEGYLPIVKAALKEMDRQVGGLKTHKGITYKGLLIRHLLLPGKLDESKKILDFIKSNLSNDVMVNLMAQYKPANLAHNYPPLDRSLSFSDYLEIRSYAKKLGIRLT